MSFHSIKRKLVPHNTQSLSQNNPNILDNIRDTQSCYTQIETSPLQSGKDLPNPLILFEDSNELLPQLLCLYIQTRN